MWHAKGHEHRRTIGVVEVGGAVVVGVQVFRDTGARASKASVETVEWMPRPAETEYRAFARRTFRMAEVA